MGEMDVQLHIRIVDTDDVGEDEDGVVGGFVFGVGEVGAD